MKNSSQIPTELPAVYKSEEYSNRLKALDERIGDSWLMSLREDYRNACEQEVMIRQTINAAVNNFEKLGVHASYSTNNAHSGRSQCGANNGEAYQVLLDEKLLEEYLLPAKGTRDAIKQGDKYLMLVVTPKLLTLVEKHLDRKRK